MPWLFGDFTLDDGRRQLLRAGIPIPLEPKAYELLSLLLARRPRALSKDQIHHVLWAGTFVSESALAGLVADLRSVLGDDARRPRYIRTVHGFGYAFCSEAREPGEAAADVSGPVLRTLVLSRSGAQRSFDRPFAALTAALDDRTGAAVHVSEFAAGSRPPVVLQQLASLAQPTQVLLSRAAFDLTREAADGTGESLKWLAHGPYLFDGMREPIEVFEVGRPGEAFLSPPPDTSSARRAVRPGDETTLGWRPAAGLRVPERDEWTFLDKLGEGGFGEVWLASHPSGERRVFKFCFDAARLRGLKREATLFQLLKDELGDREDIAKVLDWNFDEPPYFLESEYTEGGSLADWAKAAGGIAAVAVETRLLLIAQLAEALAAAHSVGVLHKDVKPQNVLITEDEHGQPKARLTDFGVGLVRDRSVLLGRDFTVTGFTEATGDGNHRSWGGTRLYAAPEVLEGRTPTTLADIYALGVMLYQVVVGDLERAFAPGWERDVTDDLLREDIGLCVEGRPERRLGNALHLAERLRTLKERRAAKDAPRRQRRIRRAWTAVGAAAAVVLGTTLFILGQHVAERPVPRVHRITFQPHAVGNARFSADGQTVLYVRWGERPNEIFSVRLDSVESRPLGVLGNVTATAPGEMAVLLPNFTLARLPIDGGIPREIAKHVLAADWGPDGSLAVLYGAYPLRVEFPLGRLLYDAGPRIRGENLRVSPRGDRVAFIEHPSGGSGGLASDPGHLVVIDREGQKLVSSEWTFIGGLAWSPDGEEVWFTATKTGFASAIHALSLAGRERLVAEMGETIYLHDISRDGRVLVAQGRVSAEARGRIAPDGVERDYSWLDGTSGVRFSPDGRSFIFTEVLEGGGSAKRAYLRRTDGGPAVWLGNGEALDVSPDGKWVVCVSHVPQPELRLVPTGAGEPRILRRGMIDRRGYSQAVFLPDGRRLVGVGSAGGWKRLFVQELPNGEPRLFAPNGVMNATATSPDGRFVAAHTVGADRFALYPVDGGEPQAIPGLAIGDMPLRFSTDGAVLFVSEAAAKRTTLRVARLDLATGRRTAWLELRPADPAGFIFTDPQGFTARNIDVTPDGRSYLYSYSRIVSDLYVVDGLR